MADALEDGLAIVSRAWRAVAAEGAGALAGSAESTQARAPDGRGEERTYEPLAFDVMVAVTALVLRMPLVHDNAVDFEAVRAAIEV